MILSVSRRTDIPNYYSEWFYNRIKEGFLYVRNPMNVHQISEIKITPDVVDCIVFWTKNPLPMIKRIDEIKDYNYYFQFTLTGYGNDVEANLPNKKTKMIPVFQELSEKIGKQKVIWRYDPIFFSDRYTKEYHLKAFKSIAQALNGYTEKCVISFVDIYPKNKKNMEGLSGYELNDNELREFAKELSKMAADNNIKIGSCAEKINLDDCGIVHNCCIDRELIEKIIGCKINVSKDKNQRIECGCVESVEIGTYNTCKNGCAYCYANYSSKSVETNAAKYDPLSPILCSQVQEDDKISTRKVESLKHIETNETQIVPDVEKHQPVSQPFYQEEAADEYVEPVQPTPVTPPTPTTQQTTSVQNTTTIEKVDDKKVETTTSVQKVQPTTVAPTKIESSTVEVAPAPTNTTIAPKPAAVEKSTSNNQP